MEHELDIAAGAVIQDRFELETVLGAGGQGVVWLARDRAEPKRPAVIKLISSAANQRMRERFDREASVLEELRHDCICGYLASGVAGELPWLAMARAPGRTLREELNARAAAGQPFELEDLESIVQDLCRALAFAHSRGVVHRDLKPGNIMVRAEGDRVRAMVLDFGLAKLLLGDDRDATTIGRVLGTWMYMAPEQVLGLEVVPQSDVFALGAVMFELLTGHFAWVVGEDLRPLRCGMSRSKQDPRNTPSEIGARIAVGPRPSARALRPELPATIDQLLAHCLAISPQKRIQSAAELERSLSRALGETEHTSPAQRETPRTLLAPALWLLDAEQPTNTAPARASPPVRITPRQVEKPANRRWLGPTIAAVLLSGFATTALLLASSTTEIATSVVSPGPAPNARPAVMQRSAAVSRDQSAGSERVEASPPAARGAGLPDLERALASGDKRALLGLARTLRNRVHAKQGCASAADAVAAIDACYRCIDDLDCMADALRAASQFLKRCP